jgi:cyclopropane-fatty-acyl-phospholipid synthase
MPHSPWLALALRIARRITIGTLTIELPGGSTRTFQGAAPGPSGYLRLNRPQALRRFVTGGSLGFAEAYLDGDWDSPDLARLLEVLALNYDAYAAQYQGQFWHRWMARLGHLLRPNTPRGSRHNILAHYDLGNSFYRHWLDQTMTYSSARFREEGEPLEAAQQNKLRSLITMIGLKPSEHVLEIGCGWGAFAEFAAKEVGARVTAITNSDAQHAYASERIQRAGLADKVEVRLQDYRDVEGRFDRIASIEMFEAVGERYWPVFFSRLSELLHPGGRAGLQVITIGDEHFDAYRRGCDFIQRYIFPGGMLPSPGALADQIRRAGLAEVERLGFGLDYARTLQTWNRRFHEAWPTIRSLGFDERFRRLWTYYLAYCEAGFRVGFTNVLQLGLKAT